MNKFARIQPVLVSPLSTTPRVYHPPHCLYSNTCLPPDWRAPGIARLDQSDDATRKSGATHTVNRDHATIGF